MDERFLGLVRNNDVVGVSVVLLEGIVCSDACPNLGTLRDEFGRSVLELAVDRGSHEVAEVLLDHSVPMGDALLYAVDREDIRAVKMLFKTALRNDIDRSDDVDTKLGSSAFPSYMTPVMLAAQKNNYPILKILLDAGFPKPEPDDYHWTASIGNGRAWLDAYRAVCSPSYILLTSTDPFRTAFRTAKVLRDVCWKRDNYRPQLEELADQCETFAVELLGEVRTTKEIETILGHLCNPEDSPSGKAVCTLQMAVDLEMKQFVTHPLSVDHVDIMTYRELIGFHRYFTGWEKWSSAHALCVTTAIGLAYPLLCLAHLIAPKSKVGRFSSLSATRSMYWTYSWFALLILLLVESQSYRVGSAEIDSIVQGTPVSSVPISATAVLIMIWVINIGWKELKEVLREGLWNHFKQLWNILDFLMVALFLTQFALRLVTIFKLHVFSSQSTVADDWARKANENSFQPVAVADVLFSIFTIVVFMRAVSLFTFHPFLGMLLISIGRMLGDIVKFVCISGLVTFAFACGLNQLYWFYGTMHEYLCTNYSQSNLQTVDCSQSLGFNTLFNSLQSLFWTWFGMTDLSTVELRPGNSPVDVFQIQEWPAIAETAGKIIYALHHVVEVLVLANLLIAIISNSYTRAEEVKRTDWGFEVVKNSLHYLQVDVTLPPPFTLIMSMRNSLVRVLSALCRRHNKISPSVTNEHTAVHPSQPPLSTKQDSCYKEVVGSLMTRYLLQKERRLES
ncbi:short transient receptor potential channel 5-like [Branchiostoma floridae x Branchiostoma japonicum]